MEVHFKILGDFKYELGIKSNTFSITLQHNTSLYDALENIGIDPRSPMITIIDNKTITQNVILKNNSHIVVAPVSTGG